METTNNNNLLNWGTNLNGETPELDKSIPTNTQPVKGTEHTLFSVPLIKWENVVLDNEKGILDTFYQLKKEYPKMANKSNEGGWQSDNVQQAPFMIGIIKMIEFAVLSQWGTGGFVRDLWINISGKGHSNAIHSHFHQTRFPQAITGVYYLKVPDENSPLYFYNPSNIDFREAYFPKAHDLIMFPCNVYHSVAVNQSDEDRVSVAFNFETYSIAVHHPVFPIPKGFDY